MSENPNEYFLSNRQKFVLRMANRHHGTFYATINDAGLACMRLCERGMMRNTGKRNDGAFICKITDKGREALRRIKESGDNG